VFLKHADFLKVYVTYMNGYEVRCPVISHPHPPVQVAVHTIASTSEAVPGFAKWLKKHEKAGTLASFLIQPVQRVPR
jgi:hypothetical protein